MRTCVEASRGCGHRQPGGLYLMTDGAGEPCPKLPIVVKKCPTCGQGIKPARGFTWIDADELTEPGPHGTPDHDLACPLASPFQERCGLVWIGGQFYTPTSFADEAARMGVSRRIPQLPRDFAIGETWVFCGHREGAWEPCSRCADKVPVSECPECDGFGAVPVPALFYLFKPERVEYVVREDDDEEKLERMRKRGIEPVKVVPAEEQANLI